MKKVFLSFSAITLLCSFITFGIVNAGPYGTIDDDGSLHVRGGEVTPIDITITLTGEEELYDLPSLDNKTGLSLAPQTVHAIAEDSAFFKIRTWLGDKWIFPKHKIIYNLEAAETELTLTAITPIFDFPNGNENVAGELSPQSITSFEKAAGGWYHINTWLGPKWINPDIALPKDVEKTSDSLELIAGAAVLQYPNKNAKILGQLPQPSTVTAFEKTKTGWYHIHSSVGDGWIQVDESQLPQKVDEVITLIHETWIWDNPVAGRWIAKLAPQQVKAYQKWNNWYRIQTWLGDKWIIVN
jgi:hypothetical protein